MCLLELSLPYMYIPCVFIVMAYIYIPILSHISTEKHTHMPNEVMRSCGAATGAQY